ncbi:MAG: sensor histidine kinase [Rhodobacteraceae bacterium]|nr:sensor histidine kinase [Paracoccaceae bacterium]
MKSIPKVGWTVRDRIVVLCVMALISGLLVWQVRQISFVYLREDVRARAEIDLKVQVAVLDGLLDKFRLMVPLLARSPEVTRIVKEQDVATGIKLASVSVGMSGALGVWFLAPDGRTIVGSNSVKGFVDRLGETGIPKAFWEASHGQLGRQFLPPTRLLPASYVFASPVRSGDRLIGVIAARVGLDTVEQAWALSTDPIFATDSQSRILVSNQDGLRGALLDDLLANQPVKRGQKGFGFQALQVSTSLPPLNWTVTVLADLGEARARSSRAAIMAFLICLIGCGIIWGVLERRMQLRRNVRRDRAQALRLERRVRTRTAELKRAQAELVQAAKLATLGKMSAALSHEYSQPLAAIQSNAEVAEMLIGRGQSEQALGNLHRIAQMVSRMAEIARTLKGFSRRSGTEIRPVSIKKVVNEALLMLRPQTKQNEITLTLSNLEDDVTVLGGHVRLEQVLINLLANAVDAVRDREDPRVRLEVQQDGDTVLLRVEDNGPGIEKELLSQIFEPFFTTKEAGTGLGLGLSIAYKIMHDFSGSLKAENLPGGGACFTMRLPIASNANDEAE